MEPVALTVCSSFESSDAVARMLARIHVLAEAQKQRLPISSKLAYFAIATDVDHY
jgi:hypothetical protein